MLCIAIAIDELLAGIHSNIIGLRILTGLGLQNSITAISPLSSCINNTIYSACNIHYSRSIGRLNKKMYLLFVISK